MSHKLLKIKYTFFLQSDTASAIKSLIQPWDIPVVLQLNVTEPAGLKLPMFKFRAY